MLKKSRRTSFTALSVVVALGAALASRHDGILRRRSLSRGRTRPGRTPTAPRFGELLGADPDQPIQRDAAADRLDVQLRRSRLYTFQPLVAGRRCSCSRTTAASRRSTRAREELWVHKFTGRARRPRAELLAVEGRQRSARVHPGGRRDPGHQRQDGRARSRSLAWAAKSRSRQA